MSGKPFSSGSVALLLLVASTLFVACGDSDAGLSRAEVEEIVRTEMAEAPEPSQPEPELTAADVEAAIRKAVADALRQDPRLSRAEVERIVEEALASIPQAEPGLSRSEVEEIVRAALADLVQPQAQGGITSAEAEQIARGVLASIPPRSAPAEYTKFVVDNAISRYETQGLEATLAHYNREESIDGQWYVFIIDENGRVIGHPDPQRLGLDVLQWVGTDANGYNFGPEMLSATEEGKWVSYVYRNPEGGGIGGNFGDIELKNVWVARHDGLLFASGWYIDADEFTRKLVSVAVDRFREGGLAATVAYFASPGSALAGLEAAVAYYNSARTVDGRWSAFIAEEGGSIVAHSDPAKIGGNLRDLFGDAIFEATEDGSWVTTQSLRMWAAGYGGYLFGSGWHQDATEN